MHVMYTLSRLLDYPDAELLEDMPGLMELVDDSQLSAASRQRIRQFAEQHAAASLMDWQATYDGLFERGRSLSLWLFEHVHGESRDRGQAMVDLISEYRQAGLEIDRHELPDFLPLFLEFLATQGPENTREWLQQVETILATLACRLEARDSDYAQLFHVLLDVAGNRVDLRALRASLRDEKRDDTREAMDKAWEEEAVTFGPGDAQDSCPSATRGTAAGGQDNAVPVTWVDFDRTRNNAVLPG